MKLTIAKLAHQASVGVETIRFYQRKELLRIPPPQGAIRVYNDDDIQRIIFIKKAQELGFSLSEVRELLELNTRPRTTCASVKKKSLEKLAEIDQKIKDLQQMRDALAHLTCVCDESKDELRQFKVQECFALD